MAYKSILTVLTRTDNSTLIDAAAGMARREDAHLDAFCLGVDRTQTGYFYASASAYVFQESIDRAMADAQDTEREVRARLEGQGIRWSTDSAVAQMGGVGGLVGMRARFADLAVLARPYGDNADPDAESVLEAVMFEGGCPVLVLPPSGVDVASLGRRVVVGWNQSDEALHAVRRAMPILKAAEAVEIVVVDPTPHSAEGSDPGGALCQMLTRQGVRAEIAVLARTQPTIAEVLNRRASETGADLIVMGAYGKSRFREAIMGGATRNMLQAATLPLLMAR